ncbi:MAG: ankyrin repeat domain-containing protein, partial [Pyrinomonadaceae bacterium]
MKTPVVERNTSLEPPTQSLARAVIRGDTDAVQTLVAGGVDVNCRTLGGQTPLILAVVQRNSQIVQLLINAGADPQLRRPRRAEHRGGVTRVQACKIRSRRQQGLHLRSII